MKSADRGICLFITLVFSVFSIFADDSTGVQCGVCLLDYEGERELAIAAGVSSRIYETVSGIDEYMISSEERAALDLSEKRNQINEKTAEIEKLFTERDLLLFNTDPEEFEAAVIEKEGAVKKAVDELDELKREENYLRIHSENGMDQTVPLMIETPADGLLFSRTGRSIADTADSNNVDLMVYGLVDSVDDYEYIEIRLWNNLLETDSFVWRTAAEPGQVNKYIEPGLNELKTQLLGRDWAELTVEAPENAMIYLDGDFAGIGGVNSLDVEPGEINIEIKDYGFKSRKETVELEKYSSERFVFELEAMDPSTLIIQTWPAGADIYIDSVWVGESPMRVERYSETSAVMLKKDGYEDKVFFADSETGNIININLKPFSEGRSEWVPDARKRFYTSMGSFVLSLPLTSIFSSMMDQSASAYTRETTANGTENIDELTRLYNLNRAEYGLYIASAGLNIFLFLDTIIKAVDYVGAVDYFSD